MRPDMQDIPEGIDHPLPKDSRAAWMQALEQVAEEAGYFERLGERHFAAFCDAGTSLLVTFETTGGIGSLHEDARPLGWHLVERTGWSHLLIACKEDTWFRAETIYRYIDRLIDDGFFEDFEEVVFYGAGPCGYAAAAYSVAAPGARVLAIQPQATLDPRIAVWDDRFTDMRRTDFTSRYGYAPDMLEAADKAFVIYDQTEELDAMHAALFTRPNVTKLRMRLAGDALQTDLLAMGTLIPLIEALMRDELDEARFARLWRARRDYPPYLRNVLAALDVDNRLELVRALCRNVLARMKAPRFARRLERLERLDHDAPEMAEDREVC